MITLSKNETHRFVEQFIESDGSAILPIKDAPSVEIKDWKGVLIYKGISSQLDPLKGEWFIDFYVDPHLTNNPQGYSYTIEWTLDGSSRAYTKKSDFSVITPEVPSEESYDQFYLSRLTSTERLILPLFYEPCALELYMDDPYGNSVLAIKTIGTSDNCIKHIIDERQDTESFKGVSMPPDKVTTKMTTYHTYYYDTPSLIATGAYQIMWRIRRTEVSRWEEYITLLYVPEQYYWTIAPEVRQMLDKIVKNVGTPRGYSDSYLYTCVNRGVDLVNRVQPITSFSLESMRVANMGGMLSFVIEGAVMWALFGQSILEQESKFSFSGQAVTVDRDIDYSPILDQFRNDLTETLSNAKTEYFRRTSRGTVFAGRPMRLIQDYPYPMYSNTVADQSLTFAMNSALSRMGWMVSSRLSLSPGPF